MFPFQQNHGFSSDISSDPHRDIIQENPISYQASYQTSNLTNLMAEGQQLPNMLLVNSNTDNHANGANGDRKIIRREIERQRRQQMSTLHASLRSLLPLESVKGKRSICDHINEAAKYIRHLENYIQELSIKRSKLKNFSNSSSLDHELGRNYESSDNNLKNSVSVRSHVGGVEIVITCCSKEENFLLSRVLEAVIEEGFDVLSCISTRRDERLYNTIQCQVSHLVCINVAALQQKLNDVILSSRFISK